MLKRLLYRFSKKRKQCKHCGKTFYKTVYTLPRGFPLELFTIETISLFENWLSPCCHDGWIEV